MPDALVLNGLYAGYSGAPVVWDLNLRVAEGELVALLGPNGAGKTTTLLTISGLLGAIDGEVEVLGEPVIARRPHKNARRGLAHVPEDRSLFFGLSVRENLQLGCGHGKRADLKTVVSYFPALESLMSRKAGLLSGGEQQMLALGRALASRPRLLLVDEMSLGLAPVIVEGMLPVLRQIAHDMGTAIVLVEQHVHMALAVADRAYVLSHGRLAVEGTRAELVDRKDLLEVSYLGESVLSSPPTRETGGTSDVRNLAAHPG
jgi:branched-chain amino acid transport system ATP-binding protein